MKPNRPIRCHADCRGSIAIEAVICLGVLIIFLAVPLFLARYFWHYTVAQRAAHDAALYLASVSRIELKTPGPTGEPAAVALARTIAAAELAELNPGTTMLPPYVLCEYKIGSSSSDWLPCNTAGVPMSVKVSIYMPFADPFFLDSTGAFSSSLSLVAARVQMPYMGR